MIRRLIILLLIVGCVFGDTINSRDTEKQIGSGKTHKGIEWNILWGAGNSDLIVCDYEGFGVVKRLDGFFGFNWDFSIQATIYKKWMLRYTYIKLNKDFSGPVGENLDVQFGDTESYESDFEELNYQYSGTSSRITKSHIYSLGYPITKKFPVIIFLGLAFNSSEVMDIYDESKHFMDWYFMSKYDWYVENRTPEKSRTKLSYGISIPLIIQTSFFYTGEEYRLMFGVGI